MSDPIDLCIANWHTHLAGDLPGGLDALLHPDCVFFSPVVFSPQKGREITQAYLTAASISLAGDAPAEVGDKSAGAGVKAERTFHYLREVLQGHHAMLEFETSMYDPDRKRPTVVNGVDIITCDDDGLITEFKVMLRPLQAVNLVHARMAAQLAAMQPD